MEVRLPSNLREWDVRVEPKGYGGFQMSWNLNDQSEPIPPRITAQLDDAFSAQGTIVDESGAPIAGANLSTWTVNKWLPWRSYSGSRQFRVQTNENGHWEIDSLPRPSSMVGAERNIMISHPEFMPTSVKIIPPSSDNDRARGRFERVTLTTGIDITGRVIDLQGQPIVGALVRTKLDYQVLRSTMTDADGNYRLKSCRRNALRLTAKARGFAMEMRDTEITDSNHVVDFQLSPARSIRVRVLDTNGQPISNASITLTNWRGYLYTDDEQTENKWFTDENGVWEWDEAPQDPFDVRIESPAGMTVYHQDLKARDVEYEISVPDVLHISGRVIDATTKQPIPIFQVVPLYIQSEESRPSPSRDAFASVDGKYYFRSKFVYHSYRVRIRAPGYALTESQDIKSDEGRAVVDIELSPVQTHAISVTTPTGEPAVGAKVVLGKKREWIFVEYGDISESHGMEAESYYCDDNGEVPIPLPQTRLQLVVTHPSGCHWELIDAESLPDAITLKQWGTVRGTCYQGTKPVPYEKLVTYAYPPKYFAETSSMSSTITDEAGHFVLEHIFPGRNMLSRDPQASSFDGYASTDSNMRLPFECQPGESLELNYGGTGRVVTGNLQLPTTDDNTPAWRFVAIHLTLDLPYPEEAEAPPLVRAHPVAGPAWRENWLRSTAGREYLGAVHVYEQTTVSWPQYAAPVDVNGHFRIDDVRPGNYRLELRRVWQDRFPWQAKPFTISVAEQEPDKTEPVDIGPIPLEPLAPKQ